MSSHPSADAQRCFSDVKKFLTDKTLKAKQEVFDNEYVFLEYIFHTDTETPFIFLALHVIMTELCIYIYLNESGQQHAAHLLLQDDLVVGVIVAGWDEGGKEHSDEAWVAEVLEGQLTQFLQQTGLSARLHYHLEHTGSRSQSVTKPVSGTASCKSLPCASPTCKSATKTTHKQPLGGDLWGAASHHTITGYKTQ